MVYVQKQKKNKLSIYTLHRKMKFSIKDFFSKCDQIRGKLEHFNIFPYELKCNITKNVMRYMNLLLEKYYTHGFTKKNCCITAYVYSEAQLQFKTYRISGS